ncbi:3'(2'),5'-bisphosphate nucleotidase CysQ [Saccharicrinis sp. FJH62]|uniref:3'(2'),5'-bisphosphate nucleotidase CysQ n=1 Tax=Saccharicrinis sp. FJH62 TaxID=3344657 RepID=UPI0035D52A20
MNLLNNAITAAILAGEEIIKVYNSNDFEVVTKSDNSPLTKADKKAHLKITQVLQKTGIPVLSEEGKDISFEDRNYWEFFWLVDPLDGTKEFIKRNGEFTVNIALIKEGNPVMGVIYTPVTSTLFYGDLNIGAFKTKVEEIPVGEEIKFKSVDRLPCRKTEKYTIVASRSHLSIETEAIIEEKRKAFGDINIISKGSSLKLCLVAEGSADFYPRLGPTMEWDTAAGHAIAVAAGCTVIRHDNKEPLTYNKENLLNPWFEVFR